MTNYRYLTVGDTIQPGDEVNVTGFDSTNEVWFKTTESSWGMTIRTNINKHRRPIA